MEDENEKLLLRDRGRARELRWKKKYDVPEVQAFLSHCGSHSLLLFNRSHPDVGVSLLIGFQGPNCLLKKETLFPSSVIPESPYPLFQGGLVNQGGAGVGGGVGATGLGMGVWVQHRHALISMYQLASGL